MTVYKVTQVVGTSTTSFTDAVRGAIERASQTIDDVRWFEVVEMRGRVDGGEVAEFQVKLDIGFHLHASGKETGEKGAATRRGSPGGRATETTSEARSQAAQADARAKRRR